MSNYMLSRARPTIENSFGGQLLGMVVSYEYRNCNSGGSYSDGRLLHNWTM